MSILLLSLNISPSELLAQAVSSLVLEFPLAHQLGSRPLRALQAEHPRWF
jgi:hypothetical protein